MFICYHVNRTELRPCTSDNLPSGTQNKVQDRPHPPVSKSRTKLNLRAITATKSLTIFFHFALTRSESTTTNTDS